MEWVTWSNTLEPGDFSSKSRVQLNKGILFNLKQLVWRIILVSNCYKLRTRVPTCRPSNLYPGTFPNYFDVSSQF